MSHKDDQIKLLELICVDMPPADFNDSQQTITLFEEDFKKEGFSFNEALILLTEMFEVIKTSSILISNDGRRYIDIFVNRDVQSYLYNLKYPNEALDDLSEEFASYTVPVSASKILININNIKGIYKDNDFKKSYQLKRGSKREMIILFLCKKDIASISELQKATNQTATLLIKEIKAINKLLRKEILVVDDFIISIPTGGYSLNKEAFDIRLQQ